MVHISLQHTWSSSWWRMAEACSLLLLVLTQTHGLVGTGRGRRRYKVPFPLLCLFFLPVSPLLCG